MNYCSIYNQLMNKAKKMKRSKRDPDSYYENHHIIPRSLGGGNDKNNLVLLTPKEHFLAHRLLVKMYPDCTKMKFAMFMMAQDGNVGGKGIRLNSYSYSILRSQVIQLRKEASMVEGCVEFDNNLKLIGMVGCKVRGKYLWSDSFKKAVVVVICNGISAHNQGLGVSSRRSSNAYDMKTGRCNTKMIIKAIKWLDELGYIIDSKAKSVKAVSKKKLSSYRITEHGLFKFTTRGENIESRLNPFDGNYSSRKKDTS